MITAQTITIDCNCFTQYLYYNLIKHPLRESRNKFIIDLGNSVVVNANDVNMNELKSYTYPSGILVYFLDENYNFIHAAITTGLKHPTLFDDLYLHKSGPVSIPTIMTIKDILYMYKKISKIYFTHKSGYCKEHLNFNTNSFKMELLKVDTSKVLEIIRNDVTDDEVIDKIEFLEDLLKV